MSKPQARPRETLNIRIRAEERGLIDRAAAARGTNRTDFILDAARRAAEDALLDQSLISVGPKAYAVSSCTPFARCATQPNHGQILLAALLTF